jgi:hypothetical protein
LDCVRKTIEDCPSGNPAPIPFSVSEGAAPHLASLFEAIRMQRNNAVHPMNAAVSASSVRLAFALVSVRIEHDREITEMVGCQSGMSLMENDKEPQWASPSTSTFLFF